MKETRHDRPLRRPCDDEDDDDYGDDGQRVLPGAPRNPVPPADAMDRLRDLQMLNAKSIQRV